MSLYESSLLLSIDAENGDIEQATFHHGKTYTSLCMVCNNGYILVRMSSRKVLRPVTKQLRWFEATAGGIVAISLHPSAEWLACLCFNGDIQLLPIVTLVLGEKPSQSLGSYTDVSTLKQRKSATTCFCWWVDNNDRTYLITGTEQGEVFFYDAMKRCEVGNCRVKGYVGSLQVLHIPERQITYLLIGIRMGYYWSVLLEQCSSMADVNVPEDQLAGFEIIRNVVENFITDFSDTEKYEPQLQAASYETVKLIPYKGYTVALYLRLDKLTQYRDILNHELKSHRMIPGTLFIVPNNKVFFAAGYHGDKACAHVISRQGSMIKQSEQQEVTDDKDMLLGRFIQEGALVNIFPESENDTDELGNCIMVTSKHVVLIKQSMTIEELFQQMLLKKMHGEAEHMAKLVGANVQKLYKVAAENCLINDDVDQALQYCLYSKCPPLESMEMFAHHNKIKEITRYILKLFASEEQKKLHDPKKLADILIKCFIHQRLVHNKDTRLQQQFNTFVNDNFLYKVPVAMEMLAKYHMREELMTVGKSRGRLLDVMNMLCDHGDDLKVDTSIAVTKFANTFSQSNNRLFLHHMTNTAFVKSLTVKVLPNLIPHHINQLLVILHQLSEESLLQLATVMDPSQPTIQPLLHGAVSRKRSDSTGSQSSATSDVTDEPYPSLDQFIELFLLILLTLYQKRQDTESRNVAKKLPTQQIQKCTLACGINHVALVSNSQLYTWGSTKNGKLGHSDYDETVTRTPLMVETFNLLSIQVVSVSCGAEHTLALCKEGVYSWGSSSHGQLGLGDTLTRSWPVQVASLADKFIVAVCCGQYHSMALSDDYRTFVWGWGVHGQLGLGATDDHVIPTHLSLSQHVISISAGYSHSCLLTIKGHVLTCGSSHYGQLGHGNQEKQSIPLKVSAIADKKVVKIACGVFHTVAVTSDNFVYFWGKQAVSQPDSFQQYRRMRQMNHALQPIICEKTGLEGGIAEVRCGSAHSMLLTATGQVYVWGSNSHGQLGMSHFTEVSAPRKLISLAGVNIVSIAAGDDYCVAVDDMGKVWGWGICDQVQLGNCDNLTQSSDGKPCSFSPFTIMEMSCFTEQTDSVSLLGWDLPDLSSVDPSGEPYGCEVLDTCLTKLKDYYHTSTILRYCRQWQLWDIMARIYAITCQYPQAMECMLKHSSGDNVKEVLTTLDEYMRSLNSTEKILENHCSAGIDLLLPVIKWFEKHKQPITLLEKTLTVYLDTFAHSLSSLLQSGDVSFSTSFQLKVMGNVVKNLPVGTVTSSETGSHTSFEDTDRLWSEVMRNLAIGKTAGISTSETNLHFLREASNRRTYFWSQQLPADGVVLFTCGHSYTRIQFQCIVDEFEEHLQELPIPPPAFIVEHYRGNGSPLLTLGCPYCVFSTLRKQQLQQFPEVPIRAWSPQ